MSFLLLLSIAGPAAGQSKSKTWKEQESWYRFTDKENARDKTFGADWLKQSTSPKPGSQSARLSLPAPHPT